MSYGLPGLSQFAYSLSVKVNNWPSVASLGQFFYILLVVAFVSLLAYYSIKMLAIARGGRRFGGGQQRNLEIIESVGVSAQGMTQIIRAGDQYFLIGVTKEKITLLAELDKTQINKPTPVQWDNSFEKVLRRLIKRDKPGAEDAQNEAHDDE